MSQETPHMLRGDKISGNLHENLSTFMSLTGVFSSTAVRRDPFMLGHVSTNRETGSVFVSIDARSLTTVAVEKQ